MMLFARTEDQERFEIRDVPIFQRPWTYLLCEKMPVVATVFGMDLRVGLLLMQTFYLAWGIVMMSFTSWYHGRLEMEYKYYHLSLTLIIFAYIVAILEIFLAGTLFYTLPYDIQSPFLLLHQWLKGLTVVLYFSCAIIGFCFSWQTGLTCLMAFFFSMYIWLCTNSLCKKEEIFTLKRLAGLQHNSA